MNLSASVCLCSLTFDCMYDSGCTGEDWGLLVTFFLWEIGYGRAKYGDRHCTWIN